MISDEKRLLRATPKRFHVKAKELIRQFNQRGKILLSNLLI
jgi:hypothetical protein